MHGASIGIVTCHPLPEPDPDEGLMLNAFQKAGFNTRLIAWNDPDADAGQFDLCLLHSCWDYYRDPASFLAFVERADAGGRILNAPSVVRWNHHKAYLHDLQECGVPIIPTVWINRGDRVSLGEILEEQGWDDVVVKPSVSASSFRTMRFRAGETVEGEKFLGELVRDRDAMVQRYIHGGDNPTETSLIWIDGAFTHAVQKAPRFHGGHEETSDALPVPKDCAALGARALDCVDESLLYARVDIMTDASGELLLSELELIEPSLYFRESLTALDLYVDAVGRWIKAG